MASSKNVIMYFPNWGVYNVNHQNITVEMIPWDKVTLIQHAFFQISDSWKLISTDDWADFQKTFAHSDPAPDGLKGHIGEYKYFKGQYPTKKVMISIGGWTKSYNFSAMASDPNKRKIFIDSCIEFLKKYPFIDGFDIDWEFPVASDKPNFTTLLKEIRQSYVTNSLTGKLLTIAAPAGVQNILNQDVANYQQYIDYLSIMSYDYYGSWDNLTNHHSPLYYNVANTAQYAQDYNASKSAELYVKAGAPKEKINIGTPLYSRGWKNVKFMDSTDTGLYKAAQGAPVGTWDEAWDPGGQWPWFQIDKLEMQSEWQKYYDEVAQSPYLVNRSQAYLLTYEDKKSLRAKCNYIVNNGYAGIMCWEISGDDLANGAPMTSLMWDLLVVNQGGPPAAIAPAPPIGTVDYPVSSDGNYNVRFTVTKGNSAESFDFLENNISVKTGFFTPNSPVDQVGSFQRLNMNNGTYVYKLILKNSSFTTVSDPVVVNVQRAANSTTIPAAPIMSVDIPNNTGSYTLNVLVSANTNATSLRIYENNIVLQQIAIKTSTQQQTFTANMVDKKTGIYYYYAALSNTKGQSKSATITVTINNPTTTVGNQLPTNPVVSHNNWTELKTYKIKSDMWWGVNATSIALYENTTLVNTKTLVDKSPAAQNVEWDITNKANGTYYYYVVASNSKGPTKSETIAVNVTKGTGGAIPTPIKPEVRVSSNPNNGIYNLVLVFPKNSSANQYSLYEDNIVKLSGLLTPNKAIDEIINVNFTNKVSSEYVYKVNVSNGTNNIDSDNLIVTVKNDIQPPVDMVDATLQFVVTTDWGTGANFQITIFNNSNLPIDKWLLGFQFDKKITTIWDATMTVDGNSYSFSNPSWGGSIAAQGKFSFGGGCEGNVGIFKPRNPKLNGKTIQQ